MTRVEMAEVADSPYKRAQDSPSRQLLWELGRLQVTNREAFYETLDKKAQEQENLHRVALAAAAAEHDRIRKNAEIERERLELQIQLERARREAELKKEVERQRREKVERELAEKADEIERLRAEEAEERRASELREAQATAERARLAREKDEAEASRKLVEAKESEARKQQETERQIAEAKREAKEASVVKTRPQSVLGATIATISAMANENPSLEVHDGVDATHQRYLKIHKKYKEFRMHMMDEMNRDKALKKQINESRREIKKLIGQIVGVKGMNKPLLQKIVNLLRAAVPLTQPQVDMTMFLAKPPSNAVNTQGPGPLLYLLNIVAKAAINQFVADVGAETPTADEVGLAVSHVFCIPDFQWNGISLIDSLIAKFHVVCPVLFGIRGNEKTTEGKHRLGWKMEEGGFIDEGSHTTRMTGFGAGFASISLRNYDKSKNKNPFPAYHYWRSVALIVNTPPQEASSTQFIVLKAMIENNDQRILDIFANAAKIMLRKALVEFPAAQAGSDNPAAKATANLVEILKKTKKLYL